jgi:hypothetical protein
MAGSLGNYAEDKILDHLVGKAAFTMPADVYVGLSTADPLDDASGNAEPGGGSYARVTMADTDWAASSGGATSNATAIDFPEATASWGTITHFAIWDAATVGNMLAHGDLTASKAVGDGDTISFAIGELDITLT